VGKMTSTKIWNEIELDEESEVIVEDFFTENEYQSALFYFHKKEGLCHIPTN